MFIERKRDTESLLHLIEQFPITFLLRGQPFIIEHEDFVPGNPLSGSTEAKRSPSTVVISLQALWH